MYLLFGVVVIFQEEFQNKKGEMAYQMNDAVGWELPRHMCVESRVFSTLEVQDQETITKQKEFIPRAVSGDKLVVDLCNKYDYRYKTFLTYQDRGLVAAKRIGNNYYMNEEDFYAFISMKRRRGRPRKETV